MEPFYVRTSKAKVLRAKAERRLLEWNRKIFFILSRVCVALPHILGGATFIVNCYCVLYMHRSAFLLLQLIRSTGQEHRISKTLFCMLSINIATSSHSLNNSRVCIVWLSSDWFSFYFRCVVLNTVNTLKQCILVGKCYDLFLWSSGITKYGRKKRSSMLKVRKSIFFEFQFETISTDHFFLGINKSE